MNEIDSARRQLCDWNERLRWKVDRLKEIIKSIQWADGKCMGCGTSRGKPHDPDCVVTQGLAL